MTDRTGCSQPRLYPLFADLADRRVLIVGAGEVAVRKTRSLLVSDAQVTVVAPEVCATMEALIAEHRIVLERRTFESEDVQGAVLVFAATGDAVADAAIAEAARAAGALVNLADAPEQADFIVPASGHRGVIHIAVSTSGASPGLAGRLRDRFLASLAPEWERFAELLGAMRTVGRQVVPERSLRQRALAAAAADDELLAEVALDGWIDPAQALRAQADRIDAAPGVATPAPGPRAFVSLVGAGPGSPDLLTVRGHARIAAADVIVYDDLVDRRAFSAARPEAELVYAGKRGWRDGPERPDTGQLLVQRATEGSGRRVVRLKGGDPMVFGRAAEEMATLKAAGVPFEIVPGVTAALAAAAGSKIPLTLRGVSNSLTMATGNSATEPAAAATGLSSDLGESGPPVASLASAALSGGTLCIYMGLKGLSDISTSLITLGVPANLPVAVIEQAGSERQRCVRGVLETIAGLVDDAGVCSPAIVVVGRVVGHAPTFGVEDRS